EFFGQPFPQSGVDLHFFGEFGDRETVIAKSGVECVQERLPLRRAVVRQVIELLHVSEKALYSGVRQDAGHHLGPILETAKGWDFRSRLSGCKPGASEC